MQRCAKRLALPERGCPSNERLAGRGARPDFVRSSMADLVWERANLEASIASLEAALARVQRARIKKPLLRELGWGFLTGCLVICVALSGLFMAMLIVVSHID
jgi:hypothetical protein